MDKSKYLLAKKNSQLEKLRGDEINRRICKKYPLSAQIALLMDKDIKLQEWSDYQKFRSQIKSEVDKEFLQLDEINDL
jgi:hypothetical protein